jgi:5-methylcytosine-specific restriction endonuclease McrA
MVVLSFVEDVGAKRLRRRCVNPPPLFIESHMLNSRKTIRRRERKTSLVLYKGGCCEICGYNKYIGALEFHHTNPTIKEFGIAQCIDRTLDSLKKEVDKCQLLCRNCHAEAHKELTRLRKFAPLAQLNRAWDFYSRG